MQMLCECLEKALNQEIERCRIDGQRQSDETENEEKREYMSVQIQDGLVLPVGLPPEYKMNDSPLCPNVGSRGLLVSTSITNERHMPVWSTHFSAEAIAYVQPSESHILPK